MLPQAVPTLAAPAGEKRRKPTDDDRDDMGTMLQRRHLLLALGGMVMASRQSLAQSDPALPPLPPSTPGGDPGQNAMPFDNGSGLAPGVNPDLLPPPESPIDFPIEPVNLSRIPKQFRRQIVPFSGPEEPGTIVVDPANKFLYYVMPGQQAVRYGVGVGRAGFGWSGQAEIHVMRRWPRWVPPASMVARDKNAVKWANGQPGGPDNPMGARGLYLYARSLYAGFADTGYRIHGTNDPKSIGKAMSSGCIRMLNQDVAELFDHVSKGTKVVVLDAPMPSN